MLNALKWYGSMHLLFGVVGLFATYLLGSVAYYGGVAGFLYATPLQDFVADDYNALGLTSILDIAGLFEFIKALGDMFNLLVFFSYEVVTGIEVADGAWYWLRVLFQLVGFSGTVWVGYELVMLVFRSGILGSNWGAAVVLGGVGVGGALSVLGFAS